MTPDRVGPKELPDLFFIDVETGGLTEQEHDIVEIAVYRMQHRRRDRPLHEQELFCVDMLHRYVLPKFPVTPDAAAINGYSEELWEQRGAVPMWDVFPDIDRLLAGATPAGWNPAFDMRFLTQAYDRANRAMPKHDYHLVDVSNLVWPMVVAGTLPGQSLRYATRHFGLGEQKHTAKDDLDKTVSIYVRLMSAYMGATEVFGSSTVSER